MHFIETLAFLIKKMNYYSDTNETETNYFLKNNSQIGNDNSYSRYFPVRFCGNLKE